MDHRLSRRELMEAAGGALAAGAPGLVSPPGPGAMPLRLLGRTGLRVPLLGMGTAPAGERLPTREAVALYQEALALGIRYFDTAPHASGYGRAQEQLGTALAGSRSRAILVTKCWNPRADDALRSLTASLRELRTDHVDILLAHSLGSDRMPLSVVLGRGGVLDGLRRARREGLTRYIGVSAHNRPGRCLRLLAAADLDVIMNAVNLADAHTYGFERAVWAAAIRRRTGIVAMKVFGGQWGAARSSSRMPADLRDLAFRYALSQPGVACAVIGMATPDELRQNVARARAFHPLTPVEHTLAIDAGRPLAARWKAHLGPVR